MTNEAEIAAIGDAFKRHYDTAYAHIPEHMRDGARRYLENGIKPGGFMTAVLENNFSEAVMRADTTNIGLLKNYQAFLRAVPKACWGSPEAVHQWHMHGGLDGIRAKTIEAATKAFGG